MKKILLIIPLTLLLLFSCDSKLSTPEGGRTILISVASDYTDAYTDSKYIPTLPAPPNDQATTVGQIVELTGKDIEVYIFRVDDKKRYYVSGDAALDAFEYGDMKDVTIDNMKTSDGRIISINTKRVKFKYTDDSNYASTWDLSNVTDLIKGLNTTKNDLLIFHYSGHGLKNGSLISQLIIEDGYATTDDSLAVDTLLESLSSYNPDATKVMILDSCYSGSYVKDTLLSSCDKLVVAESTNLYDGTSVSEGLTGSLEVAFGKKNTSGTPRVYVLSASTNKQISYDGLDTGNKNQQYFSAFSFYLVRALGYDTDENKPATVSGNITFYGLYKGVWDSFPQSMKKIQTPRATLLPMDIVLF